MSAQPDLFGGQAAPAGEIVVDLRERSAWRSIRSPRDPDQYLPGVVESFCGRYTITWTEERFLDGQSQRFVAFRRTWATSPRTGLMERTAPISIASFPSADLARAACADHAEGNP